MESASYLHRDLPEDPKDPPVPLLPLCPDLERLVKDCLKGSVMGSRSRLGPWASYTSCSRCWHLGFPSGVMLSA